MRIIWSVYGDYWELVEYDRGFGLTLAHVTVADHEIIHAEVEGEWEIPAFIIEPEDACNIEKADIREIMEQLVAEEYGLV